MDIRVKKYRKEYEYSYALGAAPTVELIKSKPESVYKIYFSPDYSPAEKNGDLRELCGASRIPFETNSNIFDRLAQKENVYVIGVFFKYTSRLGSGRHIMLVNPGDAGNLGTIMRTALGFGYKDIAVISPGADCCDPKALRASMGAYFGLNVSYFDSFEQYGKQFSEHRIFSFMLTGATELDEIVTVPDKHTLVFGNEATGLPDVYSGYGETVFIRHSAAIDSLNLAIAFGIAANSFSRKPFRAD